ncbi:1950_t:CDS:2 [Ambispora gerdemannii]|uniref:1950_t:CDS:1 n=1 Tax=Ambispora gerdemannii TaxID=144530 RepID=A0A9N8Z509_9GLOM|nr:1950_t:CDS:2 [Ambispora gerdemannii]
MSISSLIDAENEQLKKNQTNDGKSTPLTPQDTTLNAPLPFSGGLTLPSAPIAFPPTTDLIPFPRLSSLPSPPHGSMFSNSFPLPSVNQAVGDVDRTRSSPPPRHSPPPLVTSSTTPNKRKWDSNNDDSRSAKMRRSIDEMLRMQNSMSIDANYQQFESHASSQSIIKNEPSPSPSRQPPNSFQMTTITCLHAAVAQKSYGSEKRFLCPPPVVIVRQPNSSLHGKPELAMSVVCETGDRPMEQKTMLDENMKGTFKYLHVSGTAKAKQFSLKLKVYNKNSNIPYAIFDSAPVTIISKPSKKTAKARNVSSCILSGTPISLFNRINSQTVRTKYMGIENGHLCAKNSSWAPFIIDVISSPTPLLPSNNSPKSNGKGCQNASSSPTSSPSTATPITYGSEIIITDTATGISSDRLIIRKVEKGRIAQSACGPVSQMQKIALQHVGTSCQNSYLSAAGPITMDSPQSQDQCTVSGASPYLGYQPSRLVHMHTVDSSKRDIDSFAIHHNINNADVNDVITSSIVEEVDDYLCWTIVGISQFQHTHFESFPTSDSSSNNNSQSGSSTNHPTTPFPTLTSNPVYTSNNTIELSVANFYHDASLHQLSSQPQQPMEVWLGQYGSLKTLEELLRASAINKTENREFVEYPLLFVRVDGVCYHSGKYIVCEKINNSHHVKTTTTTTAIKSRGGESMRDSSNWEIRLA